MDADTLVKRIADLEKRVGFLEKSLEENTSINHRLRSNDELFEQAKEIVCAMDTVTTSQLQRKLLIGYARAARIIEQLEEAGIIGSGEGAKPRKVIHQPADK